MARPPEPSTSVTLLARLGCACPGQQVWNEFVERYGRKIYGWCRHWGLQEADAEDVTQEVLLKLAEKMRTFCYDPSGSFRGWLKTLTHHAWQDFVASRRRAGGGGGMEILETLHMATAREDLLQRLEKEFDRELLDTAMQRVRVRVRPHTWEAFRLLALEGLSGAQVAGQLGMKVATAFVAKSKVQKMLQEEMRRLERAEPDPAEGTP